MPKLTLAVRIAATSILILSLLHTIFWLALALSSQPDVEVQLPFQYLRFLFGMFSLAGVAGILIAIGLFRARNSARIAALVLGALVGFFCVFPILALVIASFGLLPVGGFGIEIPEKSELLRMALVYFFIFSIALWWIILLSRKSVATQFSASVLSAEPSAPSKPSCPPPIALLAWLMILTSALCALSWPLILGKIPAMLFTHIFSLEASKWIWAANIALFLACGIGLLKLQGWAYSGTIAFHGFWLVSLFVSQLSPLYENYLGTCIAVLQVQETTTFIHFNFPQWIVVLTTAIPTTLLIAGLFYYRPRFLKAVADSRHLPS